MVNKKNSKAHKKVDVDNLPLETENGNDDELLNGDEASLTSDPSIKSIRKITQARIIRSVWFNQWRSAHWLGLVKKLRAPNS